MTPTMTVLITLIAIVVAIVGLNFFSFLSTNAIVRNDRIYTQHLGGTDVLSRAFPSETAKAYYLERIQRDLKQSNLIQSFIDNQKLLSSPH